MSIYTRSGDKGETGLFGGSRINKDDLRVECYGCLDEANSFIGLAYSLIKSKDIKIILRNIQNKIFIAGAELASDEKGKAYLKDTISQEDIEELEKIIDRYTEIVGPQKSFVIPGDTISSASLHVSRTVVRRSERLMVALKSKLKVRKELYKYINRLSDVLFILARVEAETNRS